MYTVDFETEAIVGSPIVNPPRPIGVAIKKNDEPSQYFTGELMETKIKGIWNSAEPLLFHNAAFDLRVAEAHLGLPMPPWERMHDTMFLIYLNDPHAPNLALKPSAERILDLEASQRDDLMDWILDNVKGANHRNFMQFLPLAPSALVGRYARMDVDMTRELYVNLIDDAPHNAYALERMLLPHLTRATQHGVRVNRGQLSYLVETCSDSFAAVEDMIRKRLGDDGLNIDSAIQLADALSAAKVMSGWDFTTNEKPKTDRKSIEKYCVDDQLKRMLVYRGELKTCLRTFLIPWDEMTDSDGRLHPSWNQVRGEKYGTRTGRLSSSFPNFQNIPNEFKATAPDQTLVELPKLRDLILPEPGHEWVSADFDAQEMRILAHFEEGALCDAFNEDPGLDPHQMVMDLIKEKTGLFLTRKHCKNIGFGIMYGMGLTGLSANMGVDRDVAGNMVAAYYQALPGVKMLQDKTKNDNRWPKPERRWDSREGKWLTVPPKTGPKGINTLNGRHYQPETPTAKHRYRTYEYKMLNYLIQGSAADQTKMSLAQWFNHHGKDHVFMSTVHDEINISVPVGDEYPELEFAMNQSVLNVPVRSSITTGTSWGKAS